MHDFGVSFIQSGCEFDEEAIKTDNPKSFVYEAARGKFACCKKLYGIDTPLLAADTVVTAGGKILRKPKDKEDAGRILQAQSGNDVSIITAMMYESKSMAMTDISSTVYRFAPFDEKKLQRYLQSGQWEGKAGGCMVEGFCKDYIKSVRGLQSTAMGLSIEKLLLFLHS